MELEDVTSHGRRDTTDGIKLRILSWGSPWIIQAQGLHEKEASQRQSLRDSALLI
jgi:hypothetical protein